MMKKKTVLGIDVAKKKLDVALFEGDKMRKHTFPNTKQGHQRLLSWLAGRDATSCHACMEATGVYGEALALFLQEHKVKVSVVNPARIKGFGQGELSRTKTDEADAAVIARFCRAMQPGLWQPPAPYIRKLQAWIKRLNALVSMRRQEANRLQVSHESLQEDLRDSIACLDARIEKLKKGIAKQLEEEKDLRAKKKLLLTIPGVGEATVGWVLAFLGEPEKFRSARQVAAFVGLSPKHRQSGTSIHGRSRLSKVGNKLLRQALFFPAMVARKHNPILRAFADRLQQAGKSKMAILGAVMRKLIHMIHGVLKTSQPFNPNIECLNA